MESGSLLSSLTNKPQQAMEPWEVTSPTGLNGLGQLFLFRGLGFNLARAHQHPQHTGTPITPPMVNFSGATSQSENFTGSHVSCESDL